MVIADFIFIGGILIMCALGVLVGFGRGLSFFTKGIFGIIISVFFCYCFGGVFLQIPFIQTLLSNFASLWNTAENFFCQVITKMHVEIIVYYVVLFFIVQLLRFLIVKIIAAVGNSGFVLIKVVDKILGVLLFVAVGMLLFLFAFQIIYWVYGADTEFAIDFTAKIDGLFGLDYIYLNNPLVALVNFVKDAVS